MNSLRHNAPLWGLLRHVRQWVNLSPVSQWEAVRVVRGYVGEELAASVEPWPKRLALPTIYGVDTRQCWIIRAPWGDGKDGPMLRSSRVVLVDRRTGKINYAGSADDEG